MDLTEFVLARIAEDEAASWAIVPYDCPPGCCAPEGWVGHQCRWCHVAPSYGGTVDAITEIAEAHAEEIHQRSRVLAECEAKRRIVEWFDSDDAKGYGSFADGVGAAEDAVLRALALPYADHPDYQEAWKL